MKRDRWFLVLAVAVASILASTAAQSQTVKDVPREKTAIFENIEGRVAIPNNMNPYIAGRTSIGRVAGGLRVSLYLQFGDRPAHALVGREWRIQCRCDGSDDTFAGGCNLGRRCSLLLPMMWCSQSTC